MKVWVLCARGVQVASVTLHHRGCGLVPPSTWAKRVPRVVQESPSWAAYPHPPSGSRLNPTIMKKAPTQIEEDECDKWFLLTLEKGNDNEEEEI